MPARHIALAEPIAEWFTRPVKALRLDPPKGKHLLFGEPRVWITNSDGAVYAVENAQTIERYIGALLRHEDGKEIDGTAIALFEQLGLADALSVKDALFDFFTEARRAPGPSNSTPSSSHSS